MNAKTRTLVTASILGIIIVGISVLLTLHLTVLSNPHVSLSPYPGDQWPDLANTVEGRVAFNVPAKMKQGEEQRVTIRIAANASEDLSRNLANVAPFQTDKIQVAPFMTVKLESNPEAFQIVALTQEDQFVAKDTFTQWLFDVKPLKSGIQELDLLVGVRIRVGDSDQETRFNSFYVRKLTVTVDRIWATKHFLGTNWKWVVGTLLLPAIGYVLNRLRKKGKKEEGGLEFPEVNNGEDTDEKSTNGVKDDDGLE